jgi:hypothetical protein
MRDLGWTVAQRLGVSIEKLEELWFWRRVYLARYARLPPPDDQPVSESWELVRQTSAMLRREQGEAEVEYI